MWYANFKNKRTNIHFGAPIWAYKVAEVELDEIKRIMCEIFKKHTFKKAINYYPAQIGMLFVIYVSTWLQRNFKGGKLKWDDVCISLDIKYDASIRNDLITLTRSGTQKLGFDIHSIDSSDRYLATLYCQGGFPRSDLLGESKTYLMDYFEDVLKDYASFMFVEDLGEIANEKLVRLPISLQQKPFVKLTEALINHLIELRDKYHLYDHNNPIAYLDIRNPSWREELPFLVLDDEARLLINKLLNRTSVIVKRSSNPVKIKKYLKKINNNFILRSEICINYTIHPDDLVKVFNQPNLPNSFDLTTVTEDGIRFKTASFAYRHGQKSRWMVNLYENFLSGLPAFGQIEYRIYSDGEIIHQGIYPNGDALNWEFPWVFSIKEDDLAAYLGCGSVKTIDETVYIITQDPICGIDNTRIKEVGVLNDTSKKIYLVSGSVNIMTPYGNYRVKTNILDNFKNFEFTLKGDKYSKLISSVPVYLGVPNIELNNEENLKYRWVNEEKEKMPLNGDILGSGTIVIYNADEILWHHKCIILPVNFDVEIIHIKKNYFELKFQYLGGAILGSIPEQAHWLTESPLQIDKFTLCSYTVPSLLEESLAVTLRWPNPAYSDCTFYLPLQNKSLVLVDRNNIIYNQIRHAQLNMDDLHESKFIVNGLNDIKTINVRADLFSDENNFKPKITCSQQISIQNNKGKYYLEGRHISSLAARLFRHGTLPGNFVRLTFHADQILESICPDIFRYKHTVQIDKQKNRFVLRYSEILKNFNSIVLNLNPIWDLSKPPLILEPEPYSSEYELYFSIPEVKEYGDWLIWASEKLSLQPRIYTFEIPFEQRPSSSMGSLGQLLQSEYQKKNDNNEVIYQEKLNENSFEYAIKYLQFNDQKPNLRPIKIIIDEMSLDVSHNGWSYIQSILDNIEDIEPGTFYALKSLMSRPKALALLLLKSEDEKKFATVWDLSDMLPFEWYTIPYIAWEHALNLVVEQKKILYKEVKNVSIEIYNDLVFRSKSIIYLEEKGIYFKTIIDIFFGNLDLDRPIYQLESSLITDIHSEFKECRFKLYEKHERKLLSRVQTKKNDLHLINHLEQKWDISEIPFALKGFFRKQSADDRRHELVKLAEKITIELPLKVALNNLRILQNRLERWSWADLNFAISELHKFDREWLQLSMALITHAACVNSKENNFSQQEII